METIKFIITGGIEEYVFRKDSFRLIHSTYSSGDTGLVDLYFAAEGDIVDPDKISLTVNRDFISIITTSIQEKLLASGNVEIKHSTTSGVYQQVTGITYTAG